MLALLVCQAEAQCFPGEGKGDDVQPAAEPGSSQSCVWIVHKTVEPHCIRLEEGLRQSHKRAASLAQVKGAVRDPSWYYGSRDRLGFMLVAQRRDGTVAGMFLRPPNGTESLNGAPEELQSSAGLGSAAPSRSVSTSKCYLLLLDSGRKRGRHNCGHT